MNFLLVKTKLRDFLYKVGENIHLRDVERTKKFARFKKELREAIKTQILAIAKNLAVITSLMYQPNRLQILNANWKNLGEIMGEDKILDFLIFVGEKGGQAALDKIASRAKKLKKIVIEAKFNLTNEEVINFLRVRQNYLITTVDETTKEWISTYVSTGVEEGLTNEEIAGALEESIDEISENRARMIAHNETANAFARVEQETYRRNGVEKWKWITSADERVCPECSDLDGYETEQIPPLHVGCRCFTEPIIPKEFEYEGWTEEGWTGD